jgi:hypothetical protein
LTVDGGEEKVHECKVEEKEYKDTDAGECVHGLNNFTGER